jgi:hypothetical protein
MANTLSSDSVPRSLVALWLGIVGPPIIWLTQFEAKYALAGVGQAAKHTPALIATSVLAAALVLFLAYTSARERKLAKASPLDAGGGVTSRNRFMGTLGLMMSALFLLLIIAQAIADFFFSPGIS